MWFRYSYILLKIKFDFVYLNNEFSFKILKILSHLYLLINIDYFLLKK